MGGEKFSLQLAAIGWIIAVSLSPTTTKQRQGNVRPRFA